MHDGHYFPMVWQRMDHLPKDVAFAAARMSNYNRNRFRLETVSSETASPGRIVTVNLPENALLDMRSFKFHFDVTCNSVTVGGATVRGRLPAPVSMDPETDRDAPLSKRYVKSAVCTMSLTCSIKSSPLPPSESYMLNVMDELHNLVLTQPHDSASFHTGSCVFC